MIFLPSELERFTGIIELPKLGGGYDKGYNVTTLHKSSGVVFEARYYDNDELDRFFVGVLTEEGELTKVQEFVEKTEEDFFKAVSYFEKLVEEEMPEDEKSEEGGESEQSVGKFYFFKRSTSLDSKAVVFNNEVLIPIDDVEKAFTPPQSKPLGRLDMTDLAKTNNAYAIINGKFALKYDGVLSNQIAQQNGVAISDCAVFDMIPYSTSPSEEEETPEDVNDTPLNPNDIEGEDFEPKEPKDGDDEGEDGGDDEADEDDDEEGDKERKNKDQKKRKGKGKPSDEEDDEDSEDDDDLEDEDDEGDKERKNKDQKKRKGKGKPSDEEDDEDSEDDDDIEDEDDEGDKERKNKDQKERKGKGKPSDEEDDEEEEYEKTDQKNLNARMDKEGESKDYSERIEPNDVISAIKNYLNTDDIKSATRNKQENLIKQISIFSQSELKDKFYNFANLPADYPKDKFLTLVRNITNPIYN